MPTRLYANLISAPDIYVAPSGASWASPSLARLRYSLTEKFGNTGFIGDSNLAETDASALNLLVAQLITRPLTAQSISGTMKGQVWTRESSASADMMAQMTAYVVSEDGTTNRGTLLAVNNAALTNEILASTTQYRNTRFPRGYAGAGQAISTVNAQDGDRIVLEIGIRAANVSGTSFNYGLMLCSSSSTTDLAENETDLLTFNTLTAASTPNRTWFEFSADLSFRQREGLRDASLERSIPEAAPPSGETYVNRVWDPTISKLVHWTTSSPDPTGVSYPFGAGQYASCTNYTLITN